jgi:dipeptide/tripeptide permease
VNCSPTTIGIYGALLYLTGFILGWLLGHIVGRAEGRRQRR